jgi:ubiquinone/menaquinone biosynthesis C-methylase UbiE
MLNIARANVTKAGLDRVELRHGDIFATRLPEQSADLVLVHQVLHYLADPARRRWPRRRGWSCPAGGC